MLALTVVVSAAVVLGAVLGAGAGSPAGAQRPDAVPTLPLALTVARQREDRRLRPVVERAWLAEQVRWANALFRPQGVTFQVAERHAMGPAHARMETRRDRHALGHLLHDHVIDVFVVASLRDVDEPDRMRQGVHWRPRGEGIQEGAHLVILSAIAGPTVLAHELGHFFGNRHSDVPGNLMSYERGEGPPFFDRDQGRRIRHRARRFLASGELVPADRLAAARAAAASAPDDGEASASPRVAETGD